MSIANENSTAQADANKAALVAASLLTPMQRIAEESANQAEFYQAAFTLVAKSARAKWGEVNFQQNGQMVSRTFLDDEKLNPQILLELTSTLAVESQVVNQPKSRVIQTGKSTFCLTTCPFTDEQGDSEGSATLFAQVADETVVTQFEDFLVACVEVMRNCCKRIQAESNADAQRSTREEIQLTALGKAAKFSDARELCFALTNSFCRKYNCQRTAIGLVQNMHIKLQSISGMDSFVENSPVVVDIRQAMEECYDHKNRIVIQHQNQNVGVQSDNFFLNKRLHEQTGGAAVCSVPIRSNGEVVGVLNLQRDLAEPFTEDEVKTLEESVEAYAPALEMLRKANKTVSSHVKEKAREKFQSTFFGSSRKRKIFGYAMAAAAIWFVLGYMPFSPKIPCTVQSQSAMKVSDKSTQLRIPVFGCPNQIVQSRSRRCDSIWKCVRSCHCRSRNRRFERSVGWR